LLLSNSHELPATDEIGLDPLQNWTGEAETVLEPTNQSVLVQLVEGRRQVELN
jgi:hypothetical protein